MRTLIVSTLLVFVGLLAVSKAEKTPEMMKISDACLAEVQLSKEEVKSFFEKGMRDADATDKIKCHMKCMMQKQGHLNNGVVNDQKLIEDLKKFPQLKDMQAQIETAVNECKTQRGANDCDTAYKITTCLREHKSAM